MPPGEQSYTVGDILRIRQGQKPKWKGAFIRGEGFLFLFLLLLKFYEDFLV